VSKFFFWLLAVRTDYCRSKATTGASAVGGGWVCAQQKGRALLSVPHQDTLLANTERPAAQILTRRSALWVEQAVHH
jgi:hypothetical protein